MSSYNAESATEDEEREIITDEELMRRYGIVDENIKFRDRALNKLKSVSTCSDQRCRKVLNSIVPITSWLPKYNMKDNLLGDVVGGITVGIVHLPQGMAYSLLAGLPPINGLYVSFFPVLMYVLFGTTHQLSIGTFAVVSLMVGAVIDKNIPESYCAQLISSKSTILSTSSGDVFTEVVDSSRLTTSATSLTDCEEQIEMRKIQIAVGLSLAVALIHFAMYIFRLGVVTIYLSSQMVSGYTCGAAFHVLTSQVSKLLGLDIPRKSGILSLVYTYIDVFSNLVYTNPTTVIVATCCIVLLVIGKEINLRYKAKLPFALPWELALVVISTLASEFGKLNMNYDVDVVGEIPQGIRTSIPSPNDMGLVFTDAIPIAIVIFSVSVSLSRLFSEKHGYEFDSNQELLAYAVANTFGSFFQCYPSASSLSRSLIWDETGGKTQVCDEESKDCNARTNDLCGFKKADMNEMTIRRFLSMALTGLVSSVIVLIILLWLGPLFEALPQATLAAIIVVNLKRLLLQFTQLKPLWKVSKIDAVSWFVSWLAVVLLGVDLGLYVGVGFSLFTVVLRTQIATGNALVSVGNTGLYKNSRRFVGDTDKDSLVFKFTSPLIYANQERFKTQFYKALGFKPSLELARRTKIEEINKSKKSSPKTMYNSFNDSVAVNMTCTVETPQEKTQNNNHEMGGNEIINRKLKPTWSQTTDDDCSSSQRCSQSDESESDDTDYQCQLSRVILDMSSCSFIDNDGVKTLKTFFDDLNKLNIHLMLTRCSADVRASLLAGLFPSKASDDTPVFFISLKKAIVYQNKGQSGDDEDIIQNKHVETSLNTSF